jgi:hypothetical protein
MRPRLTLFALVIALLSCTALLAQQTGSISGRATATDGSALPGVTVEARSNVLPQPRVTVTDANGDYRLPALQPGTYTVTFTLTGMQTLTRRAEVILSQNTVADAKLGVQGLAESITVTAESTLVDRTSTELKSGLSNQEIQTLPVGQDYRDLLKLAPAVPLTADAVRGPSSGGSGQDNVYQFDGVNVSLPQYGTLSSEPAAYDIAQVNVTKGGAKAIDFNRAGGFTIDSVSKSGTNKFSGQVSYQILNHGMTAQAKSDPNSRFSKDRAWGEINLGGPILADRLFFYGSYYRPTETRNNRANLYGPLPQYKSTRNEEFGKLTFTPTSTLLFNGSYRTSKRTGTSSLFAANAASTTGTGDQSKQNIGILEGSWILGSRSFATVKFNDYTLKTQSRPDILADATVATALGTHIDFNNLDKIGLLNVPLPTSNAAANAFRAPFITRYGYDVNGVKTGGGSVGVATTFDNDDFFRKSGQFGYNLTLGTNMTHDLHAGYQRFKDSENLLRSTNGWGSITVLGGTSNCPSNTACAGQPIFVQAAFQQQSGAGVPPIHSEIVSDNLELNDTIAWGNWSFNAGVLASHDVYYGQGLKAADNLAGFLAAPGSKYKMYNIPFKKMVQPRFGSTWAYNGVDTVYASFALYNPAASSLPRAASWDRNLRATINAYFDANGNLIGVQPVASSSGKLFVQDMKPRTVHEYLLGTAQQVTNRWSGRLYGRYRHTDHFWEDTNNTARADFNAPPPISHDPYIPDLDARRAAIGSGSSYVIANLDGAFTKYYEATLESDWRGDKAFVHGTYTWSHYYGNFDQDGTTGCSTPPTAGAPCDDQNTFIGSSNIGDGAGRQLWNNKYGNLHGDRRNILKIYGAYTLPWRASAGAFAIYQSGQPWEAWNYEIYKPQVGGSTSDTIRYAEHAGSRKTPAHYQVDLNYTQNFPFRGYNLQLAGDVFNILDRQTGFHYQPSVHNSLFGQPGAFYDPRRFQVALRVQF